MFSRSKITSSHLRVFASGFNFSLGEINNFKLVFAMSFACLYRKRSNLKNKPANQRVDLLKVLKQSFSDRQLI